MSDMKMLLALLALLALLPSSAMAQDAAAGKEKAVVCGACHGVDGNSTIPQNPILAGQTSRYIYLQLKDFKTQTRTNDAGNMTAVLRTIPDEDLEALAAYIASLN